MSMNEQTNEPQDCLLDNIQTAPLIREEDNTQYNLHTESSAKVSSQILISGKIRKLENDQVGNPIFNARVQHRSSGILATTDENGQFRLRIPSLQINSDPTVWILSPKASLHYWPKKVRIDTTKDPNELATGDCVLRPIPSLPPPIDKIPFAQFLLSWLVHFWCSSSILQKTCFVFLVPPVLMVALDLGMPIPWTESDEVYRETVQRLKFLPSTRPIVRFQRLRRQYYAGVRYLLPSGVYFASNKGVFVEKGSELTIEKGTILRFPEKSGMLIQGQLLAAGTLDSKIRFEPISPTSSWQNIVFADIGSAGSMLSNCEIRGGTGVGATASDSGFFRLDDKSQARVGGGILLFNTYVKVASTLITNCSATYGGGVFIRNTTRLITPVDVALPGSEFYEVAIQNCIAKTSGEKRAAGGAVFVKDAYPEFLSCVFEDNRAEGELATGGAIYIGSDSRARLDNCKIKNNTATSEGGGIQVYSANSSGDDHRSGVVISQGEISSNIAHGRGGGLCAYNSRVWLDGVNFKDNRVARFRYPTKTVESSGGGVFLLFDNKYSIDKWKAPIAIDGCAFVGNSAEAANEVPQDKSFFAGGGICIRSEVSIPLRLRGIDFSDNNAKFGKHLSVPDKKNYRGWNGDFSSFTYNSPNRGNENVEYTQPINQTSTCCSCGCPKCGTPVNKRQVPTH